MATHTPQLDCLPEPPEDYTAIELAPGQEPNAMGGANSFQFSKDIPRTDVDSVRRNPDETFEWVARVPERP